MPHNLKVAFFVCSLLILGWPVLAWAAHYSDPHGFELDYDSATFKVLHYSVGPEGIGNYIFGCPTDPDMAVCIEYRDDFGGLGLFVHASSGAWVNCPNESPYDGEPLPKRDIGGIQFLGYEWGEAAAGHKTDHHTYLQKRDGMCYEITMTFGGGRCDEPDCKRYMHDHREQLLQLMSSIQWPR